jgi:CHAD domain-containing protein
MSAARQHVICTVPRLLAPSSFAFEPGEKVAPGFCRILELLGIQASHLAQREHGTLSESVHDTRVLIKFLRALLWFVRPAFSSSDAHRAKLRLPRASHLLAAQRELVVTRAILKGLSRKTEDSAYATALGQIANALDDQPAAIPANPYQALRQAAAFVLTTIKQLEGTAKNRSRWPASSDRLVQACRATEHSRKRALKTEDAVRFHDWRKKAKRLLYLLQLTQAVPGKGMARIINRVDKLQDKLGDYHDCVIALGRLLKHRPCLIPPMLVRRTVDLLEVRKDHMRKKLRRMAKHIRIV